MAIEDKVVLPEDNGVLPADALKAIGQSGAYPETTRYSRSVEFLDFERYGKTFTQILTILRPELPRQHNGREILVVCGEGGKDNGNGFIKTYEKKLGMAPWLAARGITVAIVPRLGRWNFFDDGGSWLNIPLNKRMPVFSRYQKTYWLDKMYTIHASKGQASPTGSDTFRLPLEGTELYEQMLAATPDTLVEGYRRGAVRALEILGKPREDIFYCIGVFQREDHFFGHSAEILHPTVCWGGVLQTHHQPTFIVEPLWDITIGHMKNPA